MLQHRKGKGINMHLDFSYLVFSVVIFIDLCHVISSEIITVSEFRNVSDSTEHYFQDEVAEIYKYHFEPFQGLLKVPVPSNACSVVQDAPGGDFIALVELDGCSVEDKSSNVYHAGYMALIVQNSEDQLLSIKDPVSLFTTCVTKLTGDTLRNNYLYDKGYYTFIGTLYSYWDRYFIPFLIIIGISLGLLIMFMIAKYYRQRIRERRNRLSPKKLKKIPTKKYTSGDDYDVCAICLEEYKIGERLRILPCDHAYHSKCVDPWLTEGKRTCPVCKRPVFVDGDTEAQASASQDTEETDATERTPLIQSAQSTPSSSNALIT